MTALLALSVSLSSFANCALSTNDDVAAEILTEKGYHIVDRADALFHIKVTNELSVSDLKCKLGVCSADVTREVGVTALNSIDMSGFNQKSAQSGTQIFRSKNKPSMLENDKQIRVMLNSLHDHLQFQYNDCRPRANE